MNFPGFIGPTYLLQSASVEAQRTINLYPQMDETGTGKNIAAFFGTPGLKLFCNLGTAPVRGIITTSLGRVFAIAGLNLIEVMTDGTFMQRGQLITSSGRVGIADNGQMLMIVDGPNGYGYDLSINVLSQISGFPGGVTIAFQDGFFIFNQPSTQTFWITGLYSDNVDPLDFASAEGNPDILVSLLSDHRELWLFGSQTTEVWFNSGDPNFPFTRIDGAYITHGTPAPYSPAKLDNTIYWLGQDESGFGMVWRAAGYQPVRTSTHAVEQAINSYPTITDATSWSYQQDGHAYYVLNFPSGNATWVYDAATQLWHERAYTGANGLLQRHRAECHTVAFGKHLVTDYQNGNVYVLDQDTYSDNGTAIARIRATPYITSELKNLFIYKFQLDVQTGTGQTPGMTQDPQCMLQFSDDGGQSWSNENWVTLGAVGAYKTRAIWRRLGRSRERVFKITITDPIPVAITNALIEVSKGTS